ncbi:MAG: DsbA family protein [Candidatus Binatia bacterium]
MMLAAVVSAGAANAAEIDEIRETQKKILERLDGQDKVLQQILQKVQALPAGGRAAVDPNKVYTLPVGDSPFKGDKKAKVTIVEFSDFQCPFCARSTSFVKELNEAFPKDVKIVYKHLPLTQIHPNAMPAAKAAVAAQNQDKFWEMHDELFVNYNKLTPDNIKASAEKIGLDMKKFEADMSSSDTEKKIQADMKLAAESGVTGTPTFFMDGKRMQSREVPVVKTQIEEALKKK